MKRNPTFSKSKSKLMRTGDLISNRTTAMPEIRDVQSPDQHILVGSTKLNTMAESHTDLRSREKGQNMAARTIPLKSKKQHAL